ncbi:MAG: hypothetical protein WA749_16875 [Gelidibacter sp.]
MKTVLSMVLFALAISASFSQSDTKNLIASCCTEGGRCKGSTYCSACKNCLGCKHCTKNGGSCGVCATDRKNTNTSNNKSSIYYNSSLTRISVTTTYIKGESLFGNAPTLNLREGPASNFKILEKLTPKSTLIHIETEGSWMKMIVQES